MRFFESFKTSRAIFAFLFLTEGNILAAHAQDDECSVVTYEFYLSGQIAGFIVNGQFSYDDTQVPANGIIREEDLSSLDVSFYDPQEKLLRTYVDNHTQPVNEDGEPYLNFAFDTLTKKILQDGTYNVDDDDGRFRNGFVMGEGDPGRRGDDPPTQEGLAFWSRPGDDKVPHLHVDDWADEFGYPIGFSTHEDVSFLYKTTQDRIDTGKVGDAYYQEDEDGNVQVNKLATDFEAFAGRRLRNQ